MAKYADSIYSDESLASQLLRNAVGAIEPTAPAPASSAAYSLKEDFLSTSASGAAAVQYRLQGLGATQSQDPATNKSKPTEIHSSGPPSAFQPPGLAVRAPEPITPLTDDRQCLNHETRVNGKNAADDVAMVVDDNNDTRQVVLVPSTFPDTSSREKSTKNTHMPSPDLTPPSPRQNKRTRTRRRRQRSLSPMSDDSFAGPLPPDLSRKRYMANAHTFQIPLSQLGESQDSVMDNGELSASSSQDSRRGSRSTRPWSRSPSRPGDKDHILAPSSEPSTEGHDAGEDFPYSEGQKVDDDSQDTSEHRPWFPSSAEAESIMEDLWKQNYDGPPPKPRDGSQSSHDSQEGEQAETSISAAAQLSGEAPAVEDALHRQTEASKETSVPSWKQSRHQAIRAQGQSMQKFPANLNRAQSDAGPSNYEQTQITSSSRLPATGRLVDGPPSPPAFDLLDIVEETQFSDSSNLPPTGRILPLQPPSAEPPVAAAEDDYEETQPSTAANLPPTGERIAAELQRSPARQPQTFSNLAFHSDIDVVPDSEATPPDARRESPLRLSRSPKQAAKPPSKQTKSIVAPPEAPKATRKSPVVPREEQIEEGSDDDDDVPLAVSASRTKPSRGQTSKRPRGTSEAVTPVPSKKEKTTVAAVKSEPMALRTRGSAARTGRQVIPSSISLENFELPARQERIVRRGTASSARGKAKGKGKAKEIVAAGSGSGSGAVVGPTTPKRNKRARKAQESDAETTMLEPADEVRTESGLTPDEDEEEDEALPGPLPTDRKRKRATPATRAVTRSATRVNTTITPVNRSNRRQESASVHRSGSGASATRVFALYHQDGHYYTGTVYSASESTAGRYVVKFDDGKKDSVHVKNLRLCELHIGDDVLVTEDRAVVNDVSQMATNSVTVERHLTDGLVQFEDVLLEKLCIASRSVASNWRDRKLKEEGIITVVPPRVNKTPSTPSVLGADATVAAAGAVSDTKLRKLFARIGFVVTQCPSPNQDEVSRDQVVKNIEDHGGTIIDDWGKLWRLDGKHSMRGRRWQATQSEVKLTGGWDLHSVFLLADDANMKPKFLIALALGVPCVHFHWLRDSINEGEVLDWHRYLLPAGTSESLNARISQTVDLDWGNCKEHLEDIMGNRVPSKLFEGKEVLCLSPRFMPLSTKKVTTAHATASLENLSESMVPRIILAMGASVVEAAIGTGDASKKLPLWDYVVVKDMSQIPADVRTDNCVPFPWVKECLVAGRFLPLKR